VLDLGAARPLVHAPLAAQPVLEVLDRVSHVDPSALDPRGDERLIEQLAGGADERPAGQIFRVAGLLADEHHRCVGRVLARTRSGSRGRGGQRSHHAACAASSAMERGSLPGSAAVSAWRIRLRGSAGAASSMDCVREGASASRRGISPASGRLRQYFFGISARVAAALARAGLNTAR
jgi:hypothetical protein